MMGKRLKKRVLLLICSIAGATVLLTALIVVLMRSGRLNQQPAETVQPTAESAPAVFRSDWWVNNRELDSAGGIPIIHSYIPWGSPRRPGEVREIRYLTIHETDNRSSGADSEAHNSMLVNDTSNSNGWHYTVDDHSIYHNIPDNEVGWNAGDNRTKLGGNINGIGIEICVNLTNDYEQSLRNAAALAAQLLVAYDLKLDAVRLHQDFMDKVCPHRLLSEGRVEEFYQMIRENYRELLMEEVKDSISRSYGI